MRRASTFGSGQLVRAGAANAGDERAARKDRHAVWQGGAAAASVSPHDLRDDVVGAAAARMGTARALAIPFASAAHARDSARGVSASRAAVHGRTSAVLRGRGDVSVGAARVCSFKIRSMKIRERLAPLLLLTFIVVPAALAQTPAADTPATTRALQRHDESMDRSFDDIDRDVDDVIWYFRLGDVADVDKDRIATSKPIRMKNATGQGAGNPLIIPLYVFSPKNLKSKAPLLIFIHGGVHGRLESSYAHIIREALGQGYVVVCPEYRGSVGHGSELYEQIDYGGAEVDDVHDARNWAVENLPNVDASRVGTMGWS